MSLLAHPLLSLRAEGVAIPWHETGEIAEPVPSVSAGILLRVCFGYASQPLAFLAMTGADMPPKDTRGTAGYQWPHAWNSSSDNPACRRILFKVPGGITLPLWKETITLLSCLVYERWLPLVWESWNPAFSNAFSTSAAVTLGNLVIELL